MRTNEEQVSRSYIRVPQEIHWALGIGLPVPPLCWVPLHPGIRVVIRTGRDQTHQNRQNKTRARSKKQEKKAQDFEPVRQRVVCECGGAPDNHHSTSLLPSSSFSPFGDIPPIQEDIPPTQPDFTPTHVVPWVVFFFYQPQIPENVPLFNIASSSNAGGPRVAQVGRSVSSVGGVAFAEAPPVRGRIVGKKPPPSRRRITRKRPLRPAEVPVRRRIVGKQDPTAKGACSSTGRLCRRAVRSWEQEGKYILSMRAPTPDVTVSSNCAEASDPVSQLSS